jgi:hypothetical protein
MLSFVLVLAVIDGDATFLCIWNHIWSLWWTHRIAPGMVDCQVLYASHKNGMQSSARIWRTISRWMWNNDVCISPRMWFKNPLRRMINQALGQRLIIRNIIYVTSIMESVKPPISW